MRQAIEKAVDKKPAPTTALESGLDETSKARERFATASAASQTADQEMIKAQHAFNEAVQKMMNAHVRRL